MDISENRKKAKSHQKFREEKIYSHDQGNPERKQILPENEGNFPFPTSFT